MLNQQKLMLDFFEFWAHIRFCIDSLSDDVASPLVGGANLVLVCVIINIQSSLKLRF
jgi:hypothetical protein